jgi:PAS domain S-box-containing protein
MDEIIQGARRKKGNPKRTSPPFAQILDTISEGIYCIDREWNCTYINQPAASHLGFKPEDLIGKNICKQFPQLLGTDIEVCFRQAMKAQKTQHCEVSGVITGNHLYDIVCYPIADGIVVHSRDITESKKAEEELKESEERFVKAFHSSPVALGIARLVDGTIIDANESHERLLGFNRQELIGHTSLEFHLFADPDQLHEMNRIILGGGKIRNKEIKLRTREGKLLNTLVSTEIFQVSEEKILLTTVVDISELKKAEEALSKAKDELEIKVKERTAELAESEEKYRKLVNNVNEVIVVTQDGLIKFMNGKGLEITGYSLKEIVDRPLLELVYPDDRKAAQESYSRRIAGEAIPANQEFRVLPKDGSIRWAQVNAAVITWEGRPAILAIFNDITVRKNAEEKIKFLLGFRTLLTDISTRFINVPVDRLDQEIQDAQRRLCKYLHLDLSSSYLPLPEDPTIMKLTYLLHPPEFPPVPDVLRGRDYFPWCEQQLVSGKSILVPSTKNLPPEAAVDQASWKQFGIKSSLMFPLVAGDKVIGTLSFDTVREECPWPEEMVTGLKLVAQVFANAIALKQSEETLKNNELKFRVVANYTYDWEYWRRPDGSLEYVSPSCERITGYRPEEFVNHPDLLMEIVYPEDRPSFSKHIKDKERVMATLDFRIITRGQEILWIAHACQPIYNNQGEYLGHRVSNRDITERKKSAEALDKSRKGLAAANRHLKHYANKITQVQEEERKRIAYELHDDTAQYLSILKMQIGALAESEKIHDPIVKEKLRFLEKDADRAFNDVRRYSHELRPTTLEHQGLVAALEQIADDFNKLGQLQVEVHSEGMEPDLSEEVKLGFFRIAQEALNNTRKHSKASQVDIDVRFDHKQICMTISDNGEGFNAKETLKKSGDKGSLGLMSMKERAELINAKLKIESEPGRGTKVILKVQN